MHSLLNQARAWFLEIAFVREVGVSVYVSTPEAINYNQLNKFVVLET